MALVLMTSSLVEGEVYGAEPTMLTGDCLAMSHDARLLGDIMVDVWYV